MRLKRSLVMVAVVSACFAAPAAANAATYGNSYTYQSASAWASNGANLYGNHSNKGTFNPTYNQGKVYYGPAIPDSGTGRYAPNVQPGVYIGSGYGGSVKPVTFQTVKGVGYKLCVDLSNLPDACGGYDLLVR